MTRKEELLAELRYSQEIEDTLWDRAFLELYCIKRLPITRRMQLQIHEALQSDSARTQFLDATKIELGSRETKGALPPPASTRKGRPPAMDKPRSLRTSDPRTMNEWRVELLTWALQHDGVLDAERYRTEKFRFDYPNRAFYATRGSQTLTYMAGKQKLLSRRADGVFELTKKGRETAQQRPITTPTPTPPSPPPPPPPPPLDPEVTNHRAAPDLPSGNRVGGLVDRMLQSALQHPEGILDMAEFSRSERRGPVGSSVGVPKLMEIAKRAGIFTKMGGALLRLKGKTAKSSAAGA